MDKEYLGMEDYYELLKTVDHVQGYHFPNGIDTINRAKDLTDFEIIVNRNFYSIEDLERKVKEDLEVPPQSLVVKYYTEIKEYIDVKQRIFYIEFGNIGLADLN